MPDERGNYIYTIPPQESGHSTRILTKEKFVPLTNRGFISFEFSHQLGVMKTRPGYASEIASDINNHASFVILGAIAGDDIILLIPREGVTKSEILDVLAKIIPGFKREHEELRTPK